MIKFTEKITHPAQIWNSGKSSATTNFFFWGGVGSLSGDRTQAAAVRVPKASHCTTWEPLRGRILRWGGGIRTLILNFHASQQITCNGHQGRKSVLHNLGGKANT